MTDDDHDHDPADDAQNEVENGDGTVFQYFDLMASKCGGAGKQSNDRPEHAAKAWRQANILWNGLKSHLSRNESNTWDFVILRS